MGAKAVLGGAIMLVIGVYAISLKNVQTSGMLTAQKHVNRMQNERVVDAALVLALNEVTKSDGYQNGGPYTVHALGADVSYTISNADGDSATIFLTITKNGFTENIKATVEKIATWKSHGKDKQKKGYRKMHRGVWQLTSAFVQKG